MKGINKSLIMIASGCFFSGASMAQLYVSPVYKDTVTIEKTVIKEVTKKEPITTEKKEVTFTTTKFCGDDPLDNSKTFQMKSLNNVKTKTSIMKYGINVPMFVALKNIIPEYKHYSVELPKEMKNYKLSWQGGSSWKDVLEIIEKNNNVSIKVNEDKKTIKISKK